MRVYIYDGDINCPDYIFVKEILLENNVETVSMQNADLCLFNAGVFISNHNAFHLKIALDEAISLEKKIFIIKPYGTSYLPYFFRLKKLNSIELLKSQIVAILNGDIPDSSKVLFNRYC